MGYRFDLKEADIEKGDSLSRSYRVNGGELIIINHFFWEVKYPENLPFFLRWKIIRSILWEVRRRKKIQSKTEQLKIKNKYE